MQANLSYGSGGTQTATTDAGPLPNGMDRGYYEQLMRNAYKAIASKNAEVAAPRAAAAPTHHAIAGTVGAPVMSREAAPPDMADANPMAAYGPAPRAFSRYGMNAQGQWGDFVNPLDIPAGLQDKIMGGFYGGPTNWDTSNPSIMGPQQWGTGKYTKNASGAGSSMAAIPDAAFGKGGPTTPEPYLKGGGYPGQTTGG